MSAPLRPTTNSTRASSLSASPGKDSIVYNTEVIFDASATIIGTRYRLCMDLDGTSTDFSFHDTGFSVYITPVSVVRHQVIIIGETSRVEFSCHGTGSVSTTCSTASAVYLSQRCDLNRNSGVLGDWEIHTNDDTPTVAVNFGLETGPSGDRFRQRFIWDPMGPSCFLGPQFLDPKFSGRLPTANRLV